MKTRNRVYLMNSSSSSTSSSSKDTSESVSSDMQQSQSGTQNHKKRQAVVLNEKCISSFNNENEDYTRTKSKRMKPDLSSSGNAGKVLGNDEDRSASSLHTHEKEMGTREINKENSKFIKKEIEENESDGDEKNPDYMEIRTKNMKDNEKFLASIGIFKAKEELKETMIVRKSSSQRGLKIKKEPAIPVELLPRRKSLRLSKSDTDGNTPRSLYNVPIVQDTVVDEERLPVGPLSLKDCLYSKQEKSDEYLDQFCTSLCDGSKTFKIKPSTSKNIKSTEHFELKTMSLSEECVAKVVPGRVFSLAWHPSADKLTAVAGDKYGHIGFWNVLASEKDGSEIVTAFRPHIKPVSHLSFSLTNQQKLYTSSYDATLRCLDFEKCVFDDIFSVPVEEDDLLRNFSFVDPNVMLVAHQSGFVSVVDIRTPSTSTEHSFRVSKKSVQTVHVNPQSSQHFITAGTDSNINLWELRYMNKKTPRALITLGHHTKTVSSAYFSPNGQQILSCSADDNILLFSCSKSASRFELSKRIRHNNCTGRWLTKFRPTWHPTVENMFVSGSMARPRRIEVFDSVNGSMIAGLESDNLNSVCSLNAFHPGRPNTLVGANSSGRLHVFM